MLLIYCFRDSQFDDWIRDDSHIGLLRAQEGVDATLSTACLICVSIYAYNYTWTEANSNFTKATESHINVSFRNTTIVKDYELRSLIRLLNSHPSFFDEWAKSAIDDDLEFSSYFSTFLKLLNPWLIGEPESYLRTTPIQSSKSQALDCSNAQYKTALSGEQLTKPRFIVDFIPFGYDVDKLEIRLAENFKFVDVFVLFESTMTQTGISKSLVVPMVLALPRFRPYHSKIIYLSATSSHMKSRLSRNWTWSPDNWELENLMRNEMIRQLQHMTPTHAQYHLWEAILSAVARPVQHLQLRSTCPLDQFRASAGFNGDSRLEGQWNELRACGYSHTDDVTEPIPLGIQNDGDEIISGPTLYHLKHCALLTPASPVSIPLLSFKGNVEMLHVEGASSIVSADPIGLDMFTWLAASTAPLSSFLGSNSTFRGTRLPACHMNIAAGVHISSVLDPVEVWYKSVGVQHGMQNSEMRQRMPLWFIKAGSVAKITAADVRKVTGLNSPCRSGNPSLVPVAKLNGVERNFIGESLPLTLYDNPRRYPFIVPRCSYVKKRLKHR